MNIILIIFCYLCLFCLGFLDNSRGTLYPSILNSFNISNSTGSLMFSLASLSTLFATVLSSKWLKLLGTVKSSHLGLVLYFFGCFIMWFSVNGTSNFSIFLLGCLFFGFGLGIHGITLNSIIATTVSDNYKRRIFSGLHSMYGIASLIAPWFVNIFQGNGGSWSSYLLIIGFIPLFISIFFIKTFYKHKAPPSHSNQFIKLDKKILFFVFVFSFYVTGEILMGSRLVIYLTTSQGFSLDKASIYLSSFFGLLLLGRIIFSMKHFKKDNVYLLRYSLCFSVLLVIIGIVIHPIAFIFSGFTMSLFFPAGMDLISNLYKEQVDGVLTYVMVGVGTCLMFNHFLFGQVVSLIGMDYAFGLIPLFHLLSLYFLHLYIKNIRYLDVK